ncbi:hypothetical protein AALO_G00282900 [Alosa alosa]|uniref:protein kinase C n=1 Tax=Alosa alosa TaxID=278164 RepID=A0AAV6FKA8_9TELE|nr:hypothetical protein AALO_G00282900 [Alosa alosa]
MYIFIVRLLSSSRPTESSAGAKGRKNPGNLLRNRECGHQSVMMEAELSTPNPIFIKNHEFIRTSFRHPTFCLLAAGFIWGLIKQGHKCSQCNAAVHKKCIDKIIGRCTDTEDNSKDTEIEKPHSFKTYNYKIPTFCNHCGTLLWGLFKQGRKCEDCVLNVHHRCQKKVANLCGTNQTLPSEPLPQADQNDPGTTDAN